jgi:ribosomal-protein-alanine N-acetyltransferase
MLKSQHITIELVKESKVEHIVRDSTGITIGRIFIIELSTQNRYCNFRIKFYKSRESSYELLKEVVNSFIVYLFNENDINKVNIIADEEINIMSFVDLGFRLEGIMLNTVISNNIFKDELLFGIDLNTFRNENRHRDLEIRGVNVAISVLSPADSEEVLKYYLKNREYLKAFEPDRDEGFYTIDVQRRTLIEGYRQFLKGDSVNFGIYRNDKLIGKIQLSNIVTGVFRSAFVGYSIDEDEQGNGYMKEALKLVLRYSFEELGLHRLEASTLVDNVKSQNVLKACGFKEIGINEKYLFINGKWRDHITFYKVKQ